ncbi:MAG: type II toxin-antitoxin system HicA family toxin [Patescibacteria group bacterium]|nr:type II toxin-antitoxin system HicA family toxin [Patescibacteria group bacterium]
MPKLFSSQQIVKALQKKGFVYISQKGSHVKLRKYGIQTLNVIVPANKKEIPMGTFKSIMRQARLSENDL